MVTICSHLKSTRECGSRVELFYFSNSYLIILQNNKGVLYLQIRNSSFGNGCFGTKLKVYEIFDRTEEIASLKEILGLSKSNAQFTVVTDRRRIGKT